MSAVATLAAGALVVGFVWLWWDFWEPVSCERGEVQLGGSCAKLEAGTPVDRPVVPRWIAEGAVDISPAAGQLRSSCRFRGIAESRYDVYRCRVLNLGSPAELRLLRDRRSSSYSYTVLGESPGMPVGALRRGRCGPAIETCPVPTDRARPVP